MKKLFFYSIFLILLSFTALAIEENDLNTVGYYNFDDGSLLDSTPNNNDLTNFGATANVTGILNEAYDFDGNDYITEANSLDSIGTADFSICGWFNVDDLSISRFIFDKGEDEAGSEDRIALVTYSTGINFFINHDTGSQINCIGSASSVSTDYHFCAIRENSRTILYRNNAVLCNVSASGFDLDSTNFNKPIRLGGNWDNSNGFDGKIDEVSIWNKSLSSAEVSYLYNAGAPTSEQQYPFTPVNATPTTNQSTESIVVNRQIGSTSFTGVTATISDFDFNITQPNTPYYFSHTLEVTGSAGGGTKEITCNILIDSVQKKTITRTVQAGSTGNIYFVTDLLTNSSGTYNEVLECFRSSGGGSLTVSKTVSVGHILVDSENNTLNNNFTTYNNVTADSTNAVRQSYTFTTSSVNLAEDNTLDLIFDYNIITNHNNHNQIITNIELETFGNCTPIKRGGTSGTGIGGNVCLFSNVSSSTTYDVNLWVQGDTTTNIALNEINIFIKEFIQDIDERNTTSLANINNTATTLTELAKLTINNDEHSNVDIFGFAGISILNTLAADSSHSIDIINGDTQTGFEYERNLTANTAGIVTAQEVLQSAGIDIYNISYMGSCSTGTCQYSGGDLTAYFANIIPLVLNSFNLSVFDNFDNSIINNFTVEVEGGSNFSTSTGSVLVFGSGLVNITITSNFNGGYFSTTINNHNTDNNLNVTLNQTLISWDCLEKVSGNNLNCTNPNESTIFNYNVIGNEHTQSVNVSGYYENLVSFNVTALQNETLNATMYSTNLTIQSTSSLATVTSCVYNISSNDYSWTDSIIGSPNTTVGLINGTYEILADCVGFAYDTQNVTIENVTQTFTFNLLTTNSINFTFYDEDDPLTLLSGINISFSLINDGTSNYTTNLGYQYVADLTVGDYESRTSAPNYDPRSLYFTVTNRSTQIIKIYLSNSSLTTNYIIRVADESDSDVPDAEVLLQRQYIEMDGDFVTIEECQTNSDGQCDMFIQESSSIVYRFIVVIDGVIVKTTEKQNIVNVAGVTTKQITLRVNVGTSFLTAYEGVTGLFGDVTYDSDTSLANYSFIDSTNQILAGCLVIKRQGFANASISTLQTTCVEDFSGEISINISDYIINNTVVTLEGIVNYTNTELILDSLQINNINRGANIDEDNNLLFTVMFFIMISFATIMIPNMLIQTIINFSLLFGLAFFNFNLLGTTLVLLFLSIGLIINYNKRNLNQGGGIQ